MENENVVNEVETYEQPENISEAKTEEIPETSTNDVVKSEEETTKETIVSPEPSQKAPETPQELFVDTTPNPTEPIVAETPQEAPEDLEEFNAKANEVIATAAFLESLEKKKPAPKSKNAQMQQLLNEIKRCSMLSSPLSFSHARQCVELCKRGVGLEPDEKKKWLELAEPFMKVMDIRSVNGYSLEAKELRKAFE